MLVVNLKKSFHQKKKNSKKILKIILAIFHLLKSRKIVKNCRLKCRRNRLTGMKKYVNHEGVKKNIMCDSGEIFLILR